MGSSLDGRLQARLGAIHQLWHCSRAKKMGGAVFEGKQGLASSHPMWHSCAGTCVSHPLAVRPGRTCCPTPPSGDGRGWRLGEGSRQGTVPSAVPAPSCRSRWKHSSALPAEPSRGPAADGGDPPARGHPGVSFVRPVPLRCTENVQRRLHPHPKLQRGWGSPGSVVSVGQSGSPLSGLFGMWEVLDKQETCWKGTQVNLSGRKSDSQHPYGKVQ